MTYVLAPLAIIAAIVGVIAIPFLVGVVLYNLLRLVFVLVARLVALVGGIVLDVVRLAGHLVSLVLHLPLLVLSAVFLQFDRVGQYGVAIGAEAAGLGRSVASALVMRPLRFMGLVRPAKPGAVPAESAADLAFDDEPVTPRASSGRPDEFEGYKVVGTLPRGGSGARLFIAQPTGTKASSLARQAGQPVDRVVIKSFSLDDGSSMPQIVRESRALEAARDLGLVFEHALEATRFFYVMPYVPGDDLATVTRDLHHASGTSGLDAPSMRAALNYFSELLVTLERFHHKGLWHKDIKPSNVIVSRGRVHLVDLGLVTPLRSAMTLTTHGTEYFRDPEMVRQAMRGVKVHEVDGVKFDLYSAGALLYSMLENSFPAHGSLSRFSLRVPESLQWIVRRAMADMHQRYGSAGEMLADLEVVLSSSNPFALKPGELPSMQGRRLHFKSWKAGSAGGSYRTHGFEDRHRATFFGVDVDDRVRDLGERMQGAGERVRSRMERAGRRMERKMQRKAAHFEARAQRRAPRRRMGTAVGIGLALLIGFAFFGSLFIATMGRTQDAQARFHEAEARAVVARSSATATTPMRVDRHVAPQLRSGPGIGKYEYVYTVSDANGRESRVVSDHVLEMPQTLDCRDLPPGVHLSPDAETQSLHRQHLEQASGLQLVNAPGASPTTALQAITTSGELHQLEGLGEGQHLLVLNDLSKGDSDAYVEALQSLSATLVGLGDLPGDIDALAQAKSLVAFSGPDDPAALASLSAFVTERSDLDAILWLGRQGNDGQVIGRLVQAD